jgi:hypothetical protein
VSERREFLFALEPPFGCVTVNNLEEEERERYSLMNRGLLLHCLFVPACKREREILAACSHLFVQGFGIGFALFALESFGIFI